jgi:hypothetical protein
VTSFHNTVSSKYIWKQLSAKVAARDYGTTEERLLLDLHQTMSDLAAKVAQLETRQKADESAAEDAVPEPEVRLMDFFKQKDGGVLNRSQQRMAVEIVSRWLASAGVDTAANLLMDELRDSESMSRDRQSTSESLWDAFAKAAESKPQSESVLVQQVAQYLVDNPQLVEGITGPRLAARSIIRMVARHVWGFLSSCPYEPQIKQEQEP